MIRAGAALLALALLAGCGALGKLPGLGGPNVTANVQAGAEPRQAVIAGGDTRLTVTRPQARDIELIERDQGVRTERVERLEIRHDAPLWVWLLVVVLCGLAAVQAGMSLDDYLDRRRARRRPGG
ncbi:hypothetical protein SAMN05216376_12060 [Mameliella alba]|uniref:bacteriophage spanin2 family protein n=1 Tax=Mameliella alba TaxID=561184 RepID=UPI0008885664|nr:bacteriophage spanin2 family protein [Mameliella alba]OWV41873.1 hypothetical protein CDZ96_24355 [Mameliella alba]PTR35567.1 hypothetical protein LX94_04753 [Mameliella alba]GGF83003.1 hypothetical protein GCM10011319_48750 [Mameliella alba]SDE19796.1 hypothetical protein SAMN05216376_12060 [Mameliella alba]